MNNNNTEHVKNSSKSDNYSLQWPITVSHYCEYCTRVAAMRNLGGFSLGSWNPKGPISQSAHVKYLIPSFDLLKYFSNFGHKKGLPVIKKCHFCFEKWSFLSSVKMQFWSYKWETGHKKGSSIIKIVYHIGEKRKIKT